MQAVKFKMDCMVDLNAEGAYETYTGSGKKQTKISLRAIHIGGKKEKQPVDMYIVLDDPTIHSAIENGTILTNLVLEDIIKWEQMPWYKLIWKGIVRIFVGIKKR